MKNVLIVLALSVCVWCVRGQTCSLTLQNKTNKEIITDCIVEIPLSLLQNLPLGNYVAETDRQFVPVEISANLNGEVKAVFPIAGFKAGETKKITITAGNATQYPKRTYAELVHKTGGRFEGREYKGEYAWIKTNYLRVPDNFCDHAYFIKYEGPGWENDKVAFRFYLDPRNAIDVFAKKTSGIVLPFVGVDGYESYHHPAEWGMDNMRVGKALGLGSIAVWNGEKAVRVEKTDSVICRIPVDGKVRSQVMTEYYGWDADGTKCNLRSLVSIDAGSRASHMELRVDKKIKNLATGFIKDKNAALIVDNDKSKEWSYIASFGKQSLNGDYLGLAVFFI